MRYADYEVHRAIYGDWLGESDFERLSWDAERFLELAVTGADGVCKTREHMPTDADAVCAIRRCVCALVDALWQIEQCDAYDAESRRLAVTPEGVRGTVITGMTAGSESVTFARPDSGGNRFSRAAADPEAKNRLIYGIITGHLHGIRDGRGVNLLYGGC